MCRVSRFRFFGLGLSVLLEQVVVADREVALGGIDHHMVLVTDLRPRYTCRYFAVRNERIDTRPTDTDPKFGNIRILAPLRIRTATISAVEITPTARNRFASRLCP